MDNKLVMISIAAVIGIIVLGSVLMPILDDATATTDTFTNDGYFRMSEITSETNVTIFWDHTKPTSFTINDVEYSLAGLPINKLYSIVGSDTGILRYVTAGGDNNRVQIYTASGYAQASVSDSTDMTITISGLNVTATNGTVTRVVDINQGYYIDPNGAWSMKQSDESAYIHKADSVMIFAGITNISGGGDVGVFGTGTINDGMDISYVPTSQNVPTVTFGDVTFNYTDVDKYIDLVSLTNCTFDITINSASGTADYTYFLVPHEVSAERAQHFSNGQIAIFAAMPVMIILAILLGVVALVIRSRMD